MNIYTYIDIYLELPTIATTYPGGTLRDTLY